MRVKASIKDHDDHLHARNCSHIHSFVIGGYQRQRAAGATNSCPTLNTNIAYPDPKLWDITIFKQYRIFVKYTITAVSWLACKPSSWQMRFYHISLPTGAPHSNSLCMFSLVIALTRSLNRNCFDFVRLRTIASLSTEISTMLFSLTDA